MTLNSRKCRFVPANQHLAPRSCLYPRRIRQQYRQEPNYREPRIIEPEPAAPDNLTEREPKSPMIASPASDDCTPLHVGGAHRSMHATGLRRSEHAGLARQHLQHTLAGSGKDYLAHNALGTSNRGLGDAEQDARSGRDRPRVAQRRCPRHCR